MTSYVALLAIGSALWAATAFAADLTPTSPAVLRSSLGDPAHPALAKEMTRSVQMVVDFASVIQITGGINALVLGNPAIADANLADVQTIVLTGRSVGTTNLIALDQKGAVLANILLQVSARKPGLVTVRRALVLKTYACSAGLCEGVLEDAPAEIPEVSPPTSAPAP